MKRTTLVVILLLVITIVTGGLYFTNFHFKLFSDEIEDWGNYGTYFGGIIGGVITPITVYFVYITYLSQKALTERTLKEFDKQAFETYFFDLLKTFNEIRFTHLKTWIRKGNEPKEYLVGYSYFQHVINRRLISKLKQYPNEKDKAFKYILTWDETQLGLYFGILNQILFLIINSARESEKERYFGIISSQLSNYEKIIVNYCHLHRLSENFTTLNENKSRVTIGLNEDIIHDADYDENLKNYVNETNL